MSNNEVELGRELTAEEQQALFDFLSGIENQLHAFAEKHPDMFGNAMMSLATYTVEKVYTCSPTVENASAMLSFAQDMGLQNWVSQVEAERKDDAEIITLDG